MSDDYRTPTTEQKSPVGKLLRFCLNNKLIIALLILFGIVAGIYVAPFDWELWGLPRNPVATDAIPDIGENQQIVFTEWPGRSPQDIEDQVTYPLTVSLLGVPGVKTVRSSSMFGFSSIYVIFKEDVEFYWSRSRILEKLNSLPTGTLPEGAQPVLGPDATGLGQIFWYTLEGRDSEGKPSGGWDLEELRNVQDWTVRYHLLSADGISEVASVGGFVREYQIDVDPDAMRAYNVTLPEVYAAVKASNIDVGARTIELNRVEYFIRGIGFVKNVRDIEESVVKVNENIPITVKHVATVVLGPALRRGALDKDGAEAVGGVVVARYGENPLAAIKNVKKKIAEISPALPSKTLADGTVSKVTIVPFYDRTGLIYETLGTLNDALAQEILITFVVVIIMVMHLRSSVLIGGMLPLAVLLCFIAMKVFAVDANIVALSGIAIAIGTIVDMGIVVCENILRHLQKAPPDAPRLEVIHRAASEVGSAVLTAVATTVISFLPVFTMIGAEGKLFKPLAFTKTFALIASILIALTVLPPAAHILFCSRISGKKLRIALYAPLVAAGVGLVIYGAIAGSFLVIAAAVALLGFAVYNIFRNQIPQHLQKLVPWIANIIIVLLVGLLLSGYWEPLGPDAGAGGNFIFVALLVGLLLGFFGLFQLAYPWVLRWCLGHKVLFLSAIAVLLIFGLTVWLGFPTMFGWAPATFDMVGIERETTRSTRFWVAGSEVFPGLGKEFMPALDEGSFLYMPTTMTHASIGEALDILAKQDMAFRSIPEIDSVVGKIGRAESPLDPAPIS
ncbi:MAG: efflux RND transporter permease subunit, partial [Planctomycetota bacterium]